MTSTIYTEQLDAVNNTWIRSSLLGVIARSSVAAWQRSSCENSTTELGAPYSHVKILLPKSGKTIHTADGIVSAVQQFFDSKSFKVTTLSIWTKLELCLLNRCGVNDVYCFIGYVCEEWVKISGSIRTSRIFLCFEQSILSRCDFNDIKILVDGKRAMNAKERETQSC